MTFEEALAELEKIVSELEGGKCPLDKSLELYTKGVELIKFCNERLDCAQQKVKLLVADENGNIKEEDFKK